MLHIPTTFKSLARNSVLLFPFSALHLFAAVGTGQSQFQQASAIPAGSKTPHTVIRIPTTITLILTTPTTISYGQIVDGYARLQATDNSTLTGAISFYDGAAAICTIPVTAAISCPASAGAGFITGQHILTTAYSGDATHAASTSTPVTVTVQPDATTATLTSTLNAAPIGQVVTLTATLSGSYSAPTGTVAFLDNGTLIGTATLNSSGNAILSTSTLTAGTHLINAVYAATQNFIAATSPTLSQIIAPASAAATAAIVSSSANPSVAGKSLTLTANIVPVTSAKSVPTGAVTFTDSTSSSGNLVLGTAALNSSGLATLTSSTLAPGSHSITATYAGDAAFGPSISSSFTQLINAATLPPATSFIITPASHSITVETGNSVNVLIKVSPVNGFNQPVTLGCANLPDSATCDFAATTIPADGATTTLKLTTSAPAACGSSVPYSKGGPQTSALQNALSYGTPALAGLLFLFIPKRRRSLRSLLTLLAMCTALLTISGCGACTNLGTRPGTYTLQITGTSTGSSPIAVTQTIQVIVTE